MLFSSIFFCNHTLLRALSKKCVVNCFNKNLVGVLLFMGVSVSVWYFVLYTIQVEYLKKLIIVQAIPKLSRGKWAALIYSYWVWMEKRPRANDEGGKRAEPSPSLREIQMKIKIDILGVWLFRKVLTKYQFSLWTRS